MRTGEGLDAEFFFCGFGAGSCFGAVYDFEGELSSGVFGAFWTARSVLFKAPVDVDGDTGIE